MSDEAADPQGDVIVHVFGRTDVGRTREHNEDAFVVADLTTGNATLQPEVRRHKLGPKGTMFMVADGMGGAAAGEIASAMAVEVVLGEMKERWMAGDTHDPEQFVRSIRRATVAANQQIHAFAASHTEYRGMGTTATVAGLLGDTLYVAQVGDSRAYLVRDGVARQITKDQSLMQKLIEAGELTEEEAAQSERRNIILQALGPEPLVKIELTHQQVRRGDVLVLCSDGLSGQVGKDDIARIVTEEPDLVAACKHLIDRANENGGPDNITVIAARFDGSRLNAPGTADEVGHRVFQLPETGQTSAVTAELSPATDGQPRRSSKPTAMPPIEPTPPIEAASAPPDVPPADVSDFSMAPTPVTGTPTVSPTRRQAGMVIAVALLVALVATAVWFIVRTAQKVAPAADSARPPAADSTKRPAADSAKRPAADSARPDSTHPTAAPAPTRG